MEKTTSTLAHWGAYDVTVEGDRVVAVSPAADDPDPSDIGQSFHEIDRHRILQPHVRRGYLEGTGGHRGRDEMVPVSWDQALDLAETALRRVYGDYGPEAVYGGSYGWASAGRFHHAQSQIHRFLGAVGGYVTSSDTYSHAALEVVCPYILGHPWHVIQNGHTSLSTVASEGDLVVAFGGLPGKNTQIQHSGIGRHVIQPILRSAKDRGCRFINVSPVRDDLSDDLDAEWLAPRPGSDTAIMLALMHTLVVDDLVDQAFLDRWCAGWNRLKSYILGETDGVAKDAEWASRLSELPAERLRSLAREMAAGRTLVNMAWSLQRADNGEQVVWATVALAACLGQIGMPGGGFGLGFGTVGSIGNGAKRLGAPKLPQFKGVTVDSIPVARIADMLLNPGTPYDYNCERRIHPDIKLIYWAGGNPYHHHQDLHRLEQAWQKPETIILHEPFWTATAKRADIVFPATTPLERDDIGGSSRDGVLVTMRRAIPPVGEARDDYAIFSALAERLGHGERFTEGRSSDEWLSHIYETWRDGRPEIPTFERFWEIGRLDQGEEDTPQILLQAFREDPEAHPIPTPSGRIELFSQTFADLAHPGIPPHPTWVPPTEWLGAEGRTEDQLHLLSNQPTGRLHSQLDHGRASRALKVAGREALSIHPEDAAERGIVDGDVVLVSNDRGETEAGAVVTSGVRRGVVVLPTGAWWAPEIPGDPHSRDTAGNPNVLTRDAGTSALGQGPVAQSCLVRVAKRD